MAHPGSGTAIPQDWALWEVLPCSQVQAGTSGSHLLSWQSPTSAVQQEQAGFC